MCLIVFVVVFGCFMGFVGVFGCFRLFVNVYVRMCLFVFSMGELLRVRVRVCVRMLCVCV